MPLRHEQVIDVAVELLDEVGLDGFTTRALTDRLGVQRGALYWHVKSKNELLTEVARRITEPVFAKGRDGLEWHELYVEFARRLRAAMLAHRDGARLVALYAAMAPPDLDAMAAILEGLSDHGITREMAARFGDTIASYVTGFVLQEQSWQRQSPPPQPVSPSEGEWTFDGIDHEQIFTASVATIVLGMRTEVARAEEQRRLSPNHISRTG